MRPASTPGHAFQATRLAALLLAGLGATTALPALAQWPSTTTRTEIWSGHALPSPREARERAEWEQWQQRQEQEQLRREQDMRQRDAQFTPGQESPAQRAQREQAQRQGYWTPPPPGLSDQERLWRDQQQMQREQWRQQREQIRQDDQRMRQQNEPLGQRALREQAENRRNQGRLSGGSRP